MGSRFKIIVRSPYGKAFAIYVDDFYKAMDAADGFWNLPSVRTVACIDLHCNQRCFVATRLGYKQWRGNREIQQTCITFHR